MRPYLRKSILASCLVSLSTAGFAADTAPVSAGTGSSFNPVFVSLAVLIVVLLFAIAVLGNVLRQLAVIYRDKMRSDRSKSVSLKSILLLIVFSASVFQSVAQEAGKAADVAAAAQTSPFISGIPRIDFYALMFIIALEMLIVLALVFYMRILLRAISSKPELAVKAAKVTRRIPFWDRFNAVVPIEKEQDIMLDHDYDGIKELDNSLPPWWKYGFYLTIVVAGVYLWYYHGGGNGPSSEQEYLAAVQKGEEDKSAYLAKTAGNVDESNVKMADASGIEEGKTLYVKNCAACHAADGGGLVGPNLTDDYWLHGGSLPDVFKSIKYGWQDKGMKSWKDDFSPKQMASLSSYVKTLKGTKPAAPKEKQGELYVEGDTAPVSADTAKSAVKEKTIAIQ